jgi:predicted NAD/FAD-binding protein
LRIAVVGSGISGLAAAWLLSNRHSITLFEANDYAGGHTHTVDVSLEGKTCGVDTGFLVFNEATYANLVPMLQMLRVPVAKSEMSFSLSLDDPAIAWSGTSLDTLFAQRRNLLRPGFLRMLRDILRFNREAAQVAVTADATGSLQDFLEHGRYSIEFRDWYLAPMAAAIWSCPTRTMLTFPFSAFARFFHNHGLLKLTDRPQWHTVAGGARQYVDAILAQLRDRSAIVHLNSPVRSARREANGVSIESHNTEHFDALVLACHSDQALRILGADVTAAEHAVLGAIPYQRNRALLHTDTTLLPAKRKLWSAWNYSAGCDRPEGRSVSVHYLINRLQPLPFTQPVILSLNPHQEPKQETILGEYAYDHPMFIAGSDAAQTRLPSIQGHRNTWFCGAWTRYGFHEDGLASAIAVAYDFGIEPPWRCGSVVGDSPDEKLAILREAACRQICL